MIETRKEFSELGFRLMILGFALSLIGFILVAISSYQLPDSSTSTAIVIFIGPIPIILGKGPHWPELIAIGLFVIALMVLIFAFLRSRQAEQEVAQEPVRKESVR